MYCFSLVLIQYHDKPLFMDLACIKTRVMLLVMKLTMDCIVLLLHTFLAPSVSYSAGILKVNSFDVFHILC